MLRRPSARGGLLLASLAMASCTQSSPSGPAAPGAVPGLTPSGFSLPGGVGCAAEIGRFRAVLKNDVETGNVGQGVYDRAGAELTRGDAACAAGRDADGRAILAATKSRFGYR